MSSLIKNLVKEDKRESKPKKLEDGSDEDQKPRPIIKSAIDLQRLKLEKLMKNPDKPVVIPEHRKEKDYMQQVPTFVRNVMGSSAGAGSGEFHVYRHLRRKEYARQKMIQHKSVQEQLDDEYRQKLEENIRISEEKTAKKRAKRLKKKHRAKRQKQQEKKSDGSVKNSNEDENDSSDSNDESAVAIKDDVKNLSEPNITSDINTEDIPSVEPTKPLSTDTNENDSSDSNDGSAVSIKDDVKNLSEPNITSDINTEDIPSVEPTKSLSTDTNDETNGNNVENPKNEPEQKSFPDFVKSS